MCRVFFLSKRAGTMRTGPFWLSLIKIKRLLGRFFQTGNINQFHFEFKCGIGQYKR